MICKTCLKEKPLYRFGNDKRLKSGKRGTCKDCVAEQARIWRKNNPEKMREQNRQNWNRHKDTIKENNRKYYYENKDKILEQKKDYHKKVRRQRGNHIPREEYLTQIRKSDEEKQENARAYRKRRYEEDLEYRIVKLLRRRLLLAIQHQNAKKSKGTVDYLGCTISEFIVYIESKWKPGMTWRNHGLYGWHLDHIQPCSSFDLTKEEDLVKCFHYTNIQPLWAKDNLEKGSMFDDSICN